MNLTKRESILLLALLLFAILFVEYQLVYVPGMARYEELTLENDKVENEVNEINRLIGSVPDIKARREKVLNDVAAAGEPFYDSLNEDALLWSTHDLLVKSGMTPVAYNTTERNISNLEIKTESVAELNYRLQELANAYANADEPETNTSTTPTPAPTPVPAPPSESGSEEIDGIEGYSVNVSFTGSYDQIRTFLTSIEDLKKTITVTMLSLEPAGTPGQLNGWILINYYGAKKIVPQEDPTNSWLLSPYTGGSGSPFGGAGSELSDSETLPEPLAPAP